MRLFAGFVLSHGWGFHCTGIRGGAHVARTLTGYYIGVLVVFAILNVIWWLADAPHRYAFGVFSAGFLLGALEMYIAAYLYGYRKVT
jgi:hypothetical protein